MLESMKKNGKGMILMLCSAICACTGQILWKISVQDELNLIERCTLMETDVLGDILSKYILKGEVRGAYWTEGVKSGVFLAILLRLKELLEIKKPLA